MEGKRKAAATEGKGKAAAGFKATVAEGDGERRRSDVDALRAFMSEFRPAYKEKHPRAKGSAVKKAGGRKWKAMTVEEKDRFFLEKAAEEQNQENIEAPPANKESNTSSTGNSANPDTRPGQRPTYEHYRHFGSGMGNCIHVNITSREFEDFADAFKATVGHGDGERRRNDADAWHAFMSEFRPAYKEEHPSAKGSAVNKAGGRKWKAMTVEEKDRFFVEKAAEEENQENIEAPTANKESNTSNTGNSGNPDMRPGLRPTYELYSRFGSGMGNCIHVNITSSTNHHLQYEPTSAVLTAIN